MEYTGGSSIANRPWVWGADNLIAATGNSGVTISQLRTPEVKSNPSTVPSPVQPIPIVPGTYLTISGGVVTYVGTGAPPVVTTAPPTTAAPTTVAPTTVPPTTTTPTTTVPTTLPPTTLPPTTLPPTTIPPTTPPP